jgi:hypothetical protein
VHHPSGHVFVGDHNGKVSLVVVVVVVAVVVVGDICTMP